jgi:uncharacterized OsmC-like protein
VAAKAKEFRYALTIDRTGRVTAGGQALLDLDPTWTPEHLVLAGLARCTLQSLRYHADRAGVDFLAAANASARVTKRDTDGRYAFVELDVEIDLELEPMPLDLGELLDKAERDCFVGASLTPHPHYCWRVNGRDVERARGA